MKKTTRNLLQLPLCTLLFTVLYSCTGAVDESYTNVIPTDVAIMASVNVNGLLEKAGYKDFKPVNTAIEGMYAESLSPVPEVVNAILQDPGNSGVDFDAPFYIFQQPDGASMGIVMRVGNKEKVEAWLQPIAQGMGTTSEHTIYMDDKSVCIYEKNGPSEWQLPATPEAQFNQSAAFAKMRDMKGDLRYCCSTKGLMKKYMRGINFRQPLYTETSIVGACNFEKGSASLTAALVANTPEAETELAAFKKVLRPSDGKFTSYLPESATIAASVCGKGAEYLNYLKLTPYLGGMLGGNYRFWKPMIEAIDGEAVIALTGMTDYGFSFVAYADLVPEVTEAQMKDILSQNSLDKSYWGIQDHCLYLTNDKTLSENAFKDASPSFRKGEYGKQADGKPVYLLMDIAKIMANPVLEQAAAQMGANGSLQAYSLLSGMEYELNGEYELVMRVNLKDKKENVLKLVADLLMK